MWDSLGWGTRLAILFLAITVAMAVAPGLIAPYDPVTADSSAILEPPSTSHLLGTDINGMDIWSRIVWGARIDMVIAISGTSIALIVGTLLGSVAGFYAETRGGRGAGSEVMMRGADVLQAFPPLVLGLGMVAVLGRHITNVTYVVAVVQIPFFMRLTRAAVISIRSEEFIDAARTAGNTERRIILRHVLPNSLTPAVVNISVAMGSAILLAAGLSFLGVGVPAPTPEWGYMVAVGARSLYTGQWWPAVFPGVMIGLATLSLSMVGTAARSLKADRSTAPLDTIAA